MHLVKCAILSKFVVLLAIGQINCEISNCLFVNTVKIQSENDTSYDKDMVADYDYILQKNGSKISVPKHKRGCICPNPCLSICSVYPVELYRNDIEIKEIFETEFQENNGSMSVIDLISDFNHRFHMPCNKQDLYPLEVGVKSDEWSIFKNGTVRLNMTNKLFDQSEYCFNLSFVDNSEFIGTSFVPFVCVEDNIVKNYAMASSVPFFVLTIFFYGFLPEVRNSHGKCFVMYLISVTFTYSLISCATLFDTQLNETECLIIALAVYFGTISFLTWITILSFDTFMSLKLSRCKAKFRRYLIWGLAIPSSSTYFLYLMHSMPIDSALKPGIVLRHCGVDTTRWSAAIYYYIPHMIVLIICLTLYIRLIRHLVTNERDARKYRMGTPYMKRFSIYFRLFMFMGVVWFLEILSYFVYMILEYRNFLIIALDLFNSLHGLFVFVVTFSSANNYRIIKKRCLRRRSAQHELVNGTTVTTCESL